MKRIVLLTDTLTPYRKAFYEELVAQGAKQHIEIHILIMMEKVSYRTWKYSDFQSDFTELLERRVLFGKSDTLYYNSNLKDRLNTLAPDILILSGGYTLLPVWQALHWARHKECKLFFWSESHLSEIRNYNRIKYWLREKIRRIFYTKFTTGGFWYPGEKALELIKKYAGPEVNFICVPNLIDNRYYCQLLDRITLTKDMIKDKYGLSKEKKVFFSMARLTWVKGFQPFIEAFINVKGYEQIQLVVAGNGELEKELREYAKQHNVDLMLLGQRNEVEITELLYCADCFFLPSISDPNPLSCIEAIWCGKPVLVSEHVGNYPEVVDPGKNGYVFSYNDVQDFQKKITALLEADSSWYENAGLRSREIAENRFEIGNATTEIIQKMKPFISAEGHNGDKDV